MSTDNYNKFTATYSGRKLLEQHRLDETGFWQIQGEDPNCDLGGYHHQPDLGVVEGKLEDVIRYAVNLRSFWTWGAGGEIRKISPIPKIDAASNERRVKLQQELAELERRVSEIKRELGV